MALPRKPDWSPTAAPPGRAIVAKVLEELTVFIAPRGQYASRSCIVRETFSEGAATGRYAQPAGQVESVSILLADDHPNFPRLVQNLLGPPFEVVASVRDGESLIRACSTLRPKIVVTDISMPILNGIDAVCRLQKSGSTSKFVFLTVHTDPDFVQACFATGAVGYVIKTKVVSDLLTALHEVLAGRTFVSRMISQ